MKIQMRSRTPAAQLIVVAAVTLYGGLSAHAATPTSELAPTAPVTAEQADEARQHYSQGDLYFNMGRFDDAIAEFEKAYALSRAPRLLFNLAQAHRLAGNSTQALHLYHSFLREEPDAPFRADVEQHIRALNAELKDTEQGGGTPATTSTDSRADTADGPTLPFAAPQVAGGVAGVLGVVSLVIGGAFAASAAAASEELSQLARDGGTWSAASAERYANGERDQVVAVVGLLAGGLLVAGGGAILLVPWLIEE